jgi:hypothetical protein
MKTPKYVTAKANCNDIMPIKGITPEKDYKVVGMHNNGKSVIIINDYGYEDLYHLSHFYPLSTQEPIESEESVRGFEGLVRSDIEPSRGAYFVLAELTQDQKEYLNIILPVYEKSFTDTYPSWQWVYFDGLHWVACMSDYHLAVEKVSFNDVFVYEEDI